MSTSQQDRDMTPEEKFRILFDRVAKLNDRTSALIAPEWGAEVGILPEGHPLHPSHRSSIPNWLVQGTRDLSVPEQAPVAAEEQTLRWTRRESLLVLLTRLQRGRALSEEEAATLRHHVETEIREADTARMRSEQTGQRLGRIRSMVDAWERRLPDTIRTATAAEAVRLAVAGDDRPVMFGVVPAQPDAEVHAELEQAQAAIERVRGYLEARLDQVAVDPAEALNILTGATESTTEQPPYDVLRAAYDESWQLIEMQKEFIGSLRRTIMTATSHREDENITAERCEYCGRDHMAELYDATVAVDKLYAERFPATADGPARPGRLPEQRTPEA